MVVAIAICSVVAVFAIAILAAMACFCIKKKKKRSQKSPVQPTQPTAPSPGTNSEEDTTANTEPQTTTTVSIDAQTFSNSMDEEATAENTLFDVQKVDRRHENILPYISKTVIRQIEKSFKMGPQLGGRLVGTGEPKIEKVITYKTSDDITIVEEKTMPQKKNFFMPRLPRVQKDPLDERSILIELLKNGPRQYAFTREQVRSILSRGQLAFLKEPSLLEVSVPCVVFGDIHGQYSDLLRWFSLHGFPNTRRSVFLGDFVDRGPHGVEVIMLIICMKLIWPSNIYVIRGNHEEEMLNKNYSFYDEVNNRFPSKGPTNERIFDCFSDLFATMPLAVLIGGKILGMHGGISPKLTSLQDIRDIARPIKEFQVGTLACDLVWSDPDVAHKKEGFRPNLDREPHAGIGQLFGEAAVKELCDRIGVNLVIRGHQAPIDGYSLFANNHMLTLFSAPGYRGRSGDNTNKGATLRLEENMSICIFQIEVSEHYRELRIHDTERRRLAKEERDLNRRASWTN